MTQLEEIRNRKSDIIKVTKELYIKIYSKSIELFQNKSCNDECNLIKDKEIKPLIKALQELIA